MATREKTPTYRTPAGIAQYPRLTKPDTKFKAEGEYKITLLLSPEDAAPLIEQVDQAMKESFAQAKKENPKKAIKAAADKPYKVVTSDDGTDTVAFNFKMKAVITSKAGEKFNKRPSLFDAKGKPLDPSKVNVGGGSKCKVAFEVFLFYTPLVGAGVSLRLSAVQILELVEYSGGRDAKGFGFEAEEGFDSDDVVSETKEETPEGDGDSKPADDPEEF